MFYGCFAAGVIMIAMALPWWGAAEIRADLGEVISLTVVGIVWLVVATAIFSWFGVSYTDDVAERGNVAALIALCGEVLGVAVIYVGGNAGEGPSYDENIFSAGLATATLFAFWILLEVQAKVSMSIAEERDLASGLRMGGFLLAMGLILGRAVAGNWHSEAATVRDFIHDGWPAAVLWLTALLCERRWRPSRKSPFPPWRKCGLLPALFYLAASGLWMWHLGPWEGMPR
jgi:uncharacterized membrane protein YjfL (UPF0719 family)